MSFASWPFAVLFALAFGLRLTIGRRSNADVYIYSLLALNLVFYGWEAPIFVGLIVGSALVDFLAGLILQQHPPGTPERTRRQAVGLSIFVNLGMLGYLKYAGFFLGEVAVALEGLGIEVDVALMQFTLPIGISFYTFQSMSYTIDVYRGRITPIKSFGKFLFYVSFFPQLVAGPIVRARDFLYQLERRRSPTLRATTEGAYLCARGFFLKLVVADNLGIIVDHYWEIACSSDLASTPARVALILFAVQIFCDFAGYSSIARGLALVLGYRLPLNFNAPYIAHSFRDFWRRWHISLSQWFRDYLYFPLGGNRRGRFRTACNLALVMLVAGLWHGANNTFLAWGAVHGAALMIERGFGLHQVRSHGGVALVRWLVVQTGVLISWAFFRAASIPDALHVLGQVFAPEWQGVEGVPVALCGALILGPVVLHFRTLAVQSGWVQAPGRVEKAVLTALFIYASMTCYGTSRAFIYFRF